MTEAAAGAGAPVPSAAGRSLWSLAGRRLRQNRVAMAAAAVLVLYVLAGIFGPSLAPHDYATVYRDYVRVPAGLEPWPRPETILPAAAAAAGRARLTADRVSLDGGTLRVEAHAASPVDPRVTRYFDRTDTFRNARIVATSDDGSSVTIEADVARTRFLFGTDGNGRDLLARILISIRISLLIGALATGVAVVIGVAWGATAGYLGGRIDSAMMRLVDILYALPFIFFVILLVVMFGRNLVLMFIAVGCVEWLDMARIVRGQTLSLRRREFVAAAEAMGVGPMGILRRHIVPNTLGPVVIYVTLLIPKVILLESFLSFLGLGVQEPMSSLGVLIAQGAKDMQGSPSMLVFPALALTILLFALNFLGDGLRDALDPRDR